MADSFVARGPLAARALAFVVVAVTLLLVTRHLGSSLPQGGWWEALTAPGEGDVPRAVIHFGYFPRIAMSIVCGAALGLSGALLQHILDNPLAEPGTLGIFAGAKLALAAATLWLPGALTFGYEPPAIVGGLLAFAIVLLLGRRRAFEPVAVILAGLVVALTGEAASRILLIWHFEWLSDLFAWQSGSLAQTGWSGPTAMVFRMAVAAVMAFLLVRPLTVLSLGDSGARSLGLPVGAIRLAGLALAAVLAASVVAQVGIIAFVALCGPAFARQAGARHLPARLVMGSIAGALLLVLTDQVAIAVGAGGRGLPTGTLTAFLGAPILLLLIVTRRPGHREARGNDGGPPHRVARPRLVLASLMLLLVAAAWIALAIGRSTGGWAVADLAGLADLLPWRGPRALAAAAAGAMLALAGCLLQRITANPMAGPELLGISSGAGLGLVAALLLGPSSLGHLVVGAAALGALLTLLVVLMLGRRSGYDPAQLLLVGLALSAFLSAAISTLLASGDPRAATLLVWMSGSTYGATWPGAVAAASLACAATIVLPLAARWLSILPLGEDASRGLGLPLRTVRLVLLGTTAVLTAAATLIVGPLSFVGLIGPHIVRAMGFHAPATQLVAAALAGALMTLGADWLGRTIAFPWQIPAGLLATLIGGFYVLLLIWRRDDG